jgi:2-phosphoglycolate phosphatase
LTHPGAALGAVIFDLDGTLVDTADDFVPAVQALRAEHGLSAMDPARIRRSVSNGSPALVRLALGLTPGDADFEPQRQRLLVHYSALLGRHARLYPGLGALLQELRQRAIAWGIATNKPRVYTAPLLDALGLEAAPGSVICPDDVQEPKPHPESLERICTALGVAAETCIYVGDHARDIEAGRRAGMYTVAAAYGYIEDGDDPAAWGADDIVSSSHELAARVLPAAGDSTARRQHA